jgi:hypothetical protein
VADHSARLGGEVGHGREELRRIITEWVGAFSEFRAEIVVIRDLCGGLVLLLTPHRGRGKGSGVKVTRHIVGPRRYRNARRASV